MPPVEKLRTVDVASMGPRTLAEFQVKERLRLSGCRGVSRRWGLSWRRLRRRRFSRRLPWWKPLSAVGGNSKGGLFQPSPINKCVAGVPKAPAAIPSRPTCADLSFGSPMPGNQNHWLRYATHQLMQEIGIVAPCAPQSSGPHKSHSRKGKRKSAPRPCAPSRQKERRRSDGDGVADLVGDVIELVRRPCTWRHQRVRSPNGTPDGCRR